MPFDKLIEVATQRLLVLEYSPLEEGGGERHGTGHRQYVTPTPYAPEEVVSWLALPAPDQQRPFVLVLDPTGLTDVYGPRWVSMGGGIEYILDSGFPERAIVNVSPDPITPAAKLVSQGR